MERGNAVEKWVYFSSTSNDEKEEKHHRHQEEEEEEEALSLSDLPVNEDNQSRKVSPESIKKQEDDFDFCSPVTESEMCSADEVFFQGQILPLRHSTSSSSRRISTSEHCTYSSGFTSGSSRSSSIRSLQSSSSSSSNGSSAASTPLIHKPKNRSHKFDQSHSQASPRPQIKSSSNRNKNVGNSNQNSTTMWSHFRLGLLTTPEMGLQGKVVRTNNNSSKTTRTKSDSRERKKGVPVVDRNGGLFGGCKCSANAVETAPSWVVTMRRSASLNQEASSQSHDEEEETGEIGIQGTKQRRKQWLSRHRTFEWLKQLSLLDNATPTPKHSSRIII